MRQTELINAIIVIPANEIVGFIYVRVMNIYINVGTGAVIISAVDAIAPNGLHLEITILAHVKLLRDSRHLHAWRYGTRRLHQQ
jgi:hypothetical protein